MEKERRRRKVEFRHLQYKEKVAKRHWSVRKLTEDQRKEVLGLGGEEESRGTSAVSCSTSRRSTLSDTSGSGSFWYLGGSKIHHKDSLPSVYHGGKEVGGHTVITMDNE